MKIAGIGDNVIDRYMNMGIMFQVGMQLTLLLMQHFLAQRLHM